MSETIATPTAIVVAKPTDAEGKTLISSSPATQGTAAASSGGAAALVIIGLWVLERGHITVPPEVAAAIVTLVTTTLHWIVVKFSLSAE